MNPRATQAIIALAVAAVVVPTAYLVTYRFRCRLVPFDAPFISRAVANEWEMGFWTPAAWVEARFHRSDAAIVAVAIFVTDGDFVRRPRLVWTHDDAGERRRSEGFLDGLR